MTAYIKVKMTRNGQITVPKAIREKYGIVEGSILYLEDDGNGFKLTTPPWIDNEAGSSNTSVDELKRKLDHDREQWR